MSGGLDSTTLAYRALNDGYTVLPININYGQKNKVEQLAFQDIYETIKEEFPDNILQPINLDLKSVLNTSLKLYESIRDSKAVKERTDMEFYTPSRNLVFSTLAAMIGEIAAIADGSTEIKIGLGVHKHKEYSRDYWDITPEFITRLNHLFELNDCVNVEMYAPYAQNFKSEIVKDAIKLNVPVFSTWTCYEPQKEVLEKDNTRMRQFVEYLPCLECEACIERQKAGEEAGMPNINNYIVEDWENILPEINS
jgi:7-cyano-7-deazaguanine synthase